MDAYGNVADGNIGNFLQNLTGVAVTKEAGDIVGIGLRGAPPELNSVTLDGTRTAGATTGFSPQGDRAPLIDQVPSELIKEIEITKGNTPDQSADSLGGTVNLVTKSAFDFKQRVITYRLGLNLNTYRDGDFVRDDHGWVDLGKYGPTAALTYLDTFGADRKWGVALSGSFSQTINTRDRVQMNRPNVDNLVTTRARQLNDIDTRVRAGISGKLEYRLDETLRLGVSASFNYYTFAGDRSDWDITSTNGVADYSRLSRAAIEAGGAPRTSANAAAGIAPGFTDTYNELLHATIRNRTSSGRKLSQQSKFGTEARKKWNDTHLVVQASYNPSNSRQKSYLFEGHHQHAGRSSAQVQPSGASGYLQDGRRLSSPVSLVYRVRAQLESRGRGRRGRAESRDGSERRQYRFVCEPKLPLQPIQQRDDAAGPSRLPPRRKAVSEQSRLLGAEQCDDPGPRGGPTHQRGRKVRLRASHRRLGQAQCARGGALRAHRGRRHRLPVRSPGCNPDHRDGRQLLPRMVSQHSPEI
jgi:hypothetical protein